MHKTSRSHLPYRMALIIGMLAGCGNPSNEPPRLDSRPNVLLVVFDTTRADRTSLYGHNRPTTPTLKRLGAESAVFDAAYAPTGQTAPSHATLFTGLHPFEHGLRKNGLLLDERFSTLAEELAKEGYDTAAIVSSFVLDRKFGLAQGFHHYDDELDIDEATMSTREWEGFAVHEAFDRRADHTSDRAIAWLRQRNRQSPFFLFVHYFDPHSRYEAPPPYRNRFAEDITKDDPIETIRARYDEELLFTDAQFGRLLEALDAEGLRDDTLIVMTADHGEGLMQRGYVLHGMSVHEEEVHVPLIVSWPGTVQPQRIAAPVFLGDVHPLVLRLLGIPPTTDNDWISPMLATLKGERAHPWDEPIYMYRRHFEPSSIHPLLTVDPPVRPEPFPVSGSQYALRTGPWKYIVAPEEGREWLFNLEQDALELDNLVEVERDRADAMKHELERWVGAHGSTPPPPDAVSEEDRVRLRALGYVD